MHQICNLYRIASGEACKRPYSFNIRLLCNSFSTLGPSTKSLKRTSTKNLGYQQSMNATWTLGACSSLSVTKNDEAKYSQGSFPNYQSNKKFSSSTFYKAPNLNEEKRKISKNSNETTFRSLSSLNVMENFEEDEFEKLKQTSEMSHIIEDVVIEQTQQKPRLEALRKKLKVDSIQGHTFHKINNKIAEKKSGNGIPSQPDVKELIARLREEEENQKERSSALATSEMLTDKYKRVHTYLRISLSERCNFRCLYCMPQEGVPLQPKEELLTSNEIIKLAGLFTDAGVDKVRLTGGEPLLHPNLPSIISSISSLPTIRSVGITTNGLTLSRQLPALLSSGLTHVNISLDTLHKDKFKEITRRNGFDKVMKAIDEASMSTIGIEVDTSLDKVETLNKHTSTGRVKVNCVVMKGFNDNELRDFVMLTKDKNVDVRFIEWMPFHENGWNQDRFVSYKDMLRLIQTDLEPNGNHNGSNTDEKQNELGPIQMNRVNDGPNDTTKWYHVPGHKGRIGFITSMSEHFCSSCNRLRITADGKLKVCLFGSKEVSLRDVMRTDDYTTKDLVRVIDATVKKKTFALGGYGGAEGIAAANTNRPMTLIGG